jgi:CheY-like chemotaxis protein
LSAVVRRYRTHDDPFTVLVVEDDPATRDLVVRQMRKEGLIVEAAENGREALERLDGRAVDLILLDLMMPEMDGFEFVERLHERDGGDRIPVVVITAKDITPEDRRRLNGYVERILEKRAYSRDELFAMVRDVAAGLRAGGAAG